MKQLVAILLAIISLCTATLSFAAGSACTGTNNRFATMSYGHGKNSVFITSTNTWTTYGDVIELQYAWTSDDAAGTVTNLGGIAGISGMIVGFKAVPSVANAPSDGYTAKIVDANGITVVTITGLKAAVADAANRGVPLSTDGNGMAIVRNETLGLTITGAGNAKQVTLYIYVLPR